MRKRWHGRHPGRVNASAGQHGTAVTVGGLLLSVLASFPAFGQIINPVVPDGAAGVSDERASGGVREMAGWVTGARDNGGLPFAIVDKVHAKVFVFDGDGVLLGASPVLLGLARGDIAPPGIGDRKLSTIGPDERITPAGRFVASMGENLHAKDVLWVDYASAVSMHRVVTSNKKENRLQRLATETALDNRISYGCINVPVLFFDKVVKPAFTGTNGIVYVLPEVLPANAVFSLDGGDSDLAP